MLERVDSATYESAGFASADSTVGQTLTANGTPHNEAAAYAFVAGNIARQADGIILCISRLSAAYRGLIDLIVRDPSDTENAPFLDNFLVDAGRADHAGYCVYFPVTIPAGSDIYGRLRASVGSVTCQAAIAFVSAGVPSDDPFTYIDTYGTDTTAGSGASSGTLDSGGSSVDPGASTGTLGAWKELSSSIPRPISWLVLSIGLNANTAAATAFWELQVGTGAASSEQIVASQLYLQANTTSDAVFPNTITIPCTLPAGARLAVRCRSDINDATDRLLQVAAYGMG